MNLLKLTQPDIYVLETYLDMKLITLGISMNDSLPLIATGECKSCAISKLSTPSIVDKFDELRRIKCPEGLDAYSSCSSYDKEGLKGLILKTKIEVGAKNYELSSTLLVSKVYQGHPLETNMINGVVGLRPPDFDGNYDTAFLRQTQIENELINPTWEIRLEENSNFFANLERV